MISVNVDHKKDYIFLQMSHDTDVDVFQDDGNGRRLRYVIDD